MVTVNSIPVAWLRHLDTGLNSGFMIQTMWLCLQKIRQRANFDGLCRFILMFPYFPRNLIFFFMVDDGLSSSSPSARHAGIGLFRALAVSPL